MNIEQNILQSSEISFIAKAFLNTAASCCSKFQDEIWHSQATLAQMMSCSRRTVQRAVRELLELKLISVQRRWLRSNIYKLHCLVRPKVINNGDTVAHRTNSGYKFNDSRNNAVDIYPYGKDVDTTLVGEIESLLNSDKDHQFWLKITRKCSQDSVRAAISSLKTAMREQVIKKPAAYLTAILKSEYPGLCRPKKHEPVPSSPTQRPVEPLRPLTEEQWSVNLSGLRLLMSQLRC